MDDEHIGGSGSVAIGVRVEPRLIPFPRSISSAAYSYLVRMVDAAGTPLTLQRSVLASDDHAGWAAARARVNAMMVAMLGPKVQSLTATIETLSLGGATVHLAVPLETDPADDRAYLDIHGGGLIHGGGEPCRIGARMQAEQHSVRCYAVDYRMPPEHPYPAALDDCLAAYRAVLERHGPGNIIVGGSSAGSNLAAALALRARDEGLALPAALVLATPELDLTESGDSFQTNRMVDVMLPSGLMSTNLLYANGHPLDDPYLSPLFGDFTSGFPPCFLQAGTRDLFLSNAVRMHRALRRAGVPADLHIFEGMPHAGFMGAPEDRELADEITRFVAAHWTTVAA